MGVEARNEYGMWVPAEPWPEDFGMRWWRARLHRRGLGQGHVRAWVGGWRDVRAVDRLAATPEGTDAEA